MTRDLLSIPPVPADRRVLYGDDPNQFFDLYLPDAPHAVAMVIHGGFWRAKYDLLHVSHMCSVLAKSGVAVASLEYRRVGNSGGGWPGSYNDVRAGFAAIRKHFGENLKYVAIGHSAGGHLALRLAVDEPTLSGVAALAPVAVLKTAYEMNLSNGAVEEFLGGSPAEIPGIYASACPSQHPSTVQRILLHGDLDTDVPIAISKEFEAARQNDSGTVWFMKLEETEHMDLIDPESRAWPIVHMDIESLIDG
ncbi:putative lipase/esterase [Candidatus Koribacter versatilis Ellin345]|uniref:Lipase/esterase n=1 Tax=Koribacter versatilis (strain Ellin345) TaxID=204669 RepID=Q1ITW6_KORVE|nr:alpha/beta hydrolase [Candidatus Koribacter versatilis]ABF39684.1 putative lipase/esterase [Candidatus Koribacter versatilis Ellin345]